MDAQAVSSGGQTIGNTLTGGIQDISALLPLLGTEQCEDHVASALTNGFLYAAASPLSLFGSLGVARAGFNTLMAAINISSPKYIPWLRFEGAKMLTDAGFKPQGMNVPLIMLDDNRKDYCAETRLESMLKDFHIENSNPITVEARTREWNIKMIMTSFLCSAISVVPYIHLNLHEPNQLSHFVRWAFPIMRAIGGFLVATTMQLVIQSRLLAIVRKRLVLRGLREEQLARLGINVNDETSAWVRYPSLDQRFSILERCVMEKLNSPSDPLLPNDITHISDDNTKHENTTSVSPSSPDIEAANAKSDMASTPKPNEVNSGNQDWLKQLRPRIDEATNSLVFLYIYLPLLLLGILGTIAGYVGCFSAVQGAESSKEALIWLILEALLSLIRIILWGINPRFDDAPPLQFLYELDITSDSPPTCEVTAEMIEAGETFPLVRAQEFLALVTQRTGFLRPFNDPRLTLYYTLPHQSIPSNPLFLLNHPPVKRIALYITIFDHTEQTTRVYTQYNSQRDSSEGPSGDQVPSFFLACSGVAIGPTPTTNLTDPTHQAYSSIAVNKPLHTALAEHYDSILNRIDIRSKFHRAFDDIQDDWRMMFEESKSLMQGKGLRREYRFAQWLHDTMGLMHRRPRSS